MMSYSSLGTQMHICIYSILIRLYIYMFLYLYIYVYIDTVQTNVETRGKRMDKRKAWSYFSRWILALQNPASGCVEQGSYVAILAKINMRYFFPAGIFSSNDLSKFIYHHFPKI